MPICPTTQRPVKETVEAQIHQVFQNLRAVAEASGGDLSHVVKLNIYLVDLADSRLVNEIMAQYFSAPYPARASVCISALPQGFRMEAEAVMVLD